MSAKTLPGCKSQEVLPEKESQEQNDSENNRNKDRI